MICLAAIYFEDDSIPSTYGILDEGETRSASRYIHACELCFLFEQGPHTNTTNMSTVSIAPCSSFDPLTWSSTIAFCFLGFTNVTCDADLATFRFWFFRLFL